MHFFFFFLRRNVVPVTPHLLGFSSGSVIWIHHFFRTNAIWKSERNYPLKCYRACPPPPAQWGLYSHKTTCKCTAVCCCSWSCFCMHTELGESQGWLLKSNVMDGIKMHTAIIKLSIQSGKLFRKVLLKALGLSLYSHLVSLIIHSTP